MRFPIIDNDGTDPVVGTFAGLPEGATFKAGSYTYWITYKGGDGNDVVLTAGAPQKTWIGASSDKWSDAANWQPQGIPVPGEPLLFPPFYGRSATTNDLGSCFNPGPMTFNFNYDLGGNALTLTNDLNFPTSPYQTNLTCDAPLKLGSSIHINSGQTTIFNGAIDVNGNTLTVGSYDARFRGPIDGSGAIAATGPGISLESSGSFSGPISGTVNVVGAYPNASVTGARVSGEGTLGTVSAGTVSAGSWLPSSIAPPHEVKTLKTGSLSISSKLIADIDPAAGVADRINVGGSVSIAGALQLWFMSAPSPGQSWTIIDNDGTDAVSGAFDNLPEGQIFSAGGYGGGPKLQITYKGGDGNDVVISAVGAASKTATAAAVAQDHDTTEVHQLVTFTATVTSSGGTPTGTVAFLDGSMTIHSATLQNGSAVFATEDLAVGGHQITVAYAGDTTFSPSSSAAIVHHVVKGTPQVTATQNRDTTEVHQPVTFTAFVTSGSGTPTGSVAFPDGPTTLGSAPLQGDSATFTTSDLALGDHQITAVYGGDGTFAASSSAPIVHHVVKGTPNVTATPSQAQPAYGDSVAYTITVGNSMEMPGGSVTLSVDHAQVGSAALSAGTATIALPLLAAGTHRIDVAYSGDAAFGAATTTSSLAVAKAATKLSVDSPINPSPAGVAVTLSVRVSATAHPSLPVDGTVYASKSGRIVAQAPLARGAATIALAPFAGGEHELTASYAASDNFEAASAALTQRVTAPALSIANATLAAGNTAREQTLQVELSAASTLLVAVDYRTVDGTAAAGADYVAAQGTLTFAPGQTAAAIPIHLLANAAAAPHATFTVELSNASGASILTPRTSVTIAHDERPYRTPADYTYATVDGVPLRLTLYAPAAGDGPWPLIVWIPGDTAYDAAGDVGALRETARGYAVASVGYRPAAAAPFPAQ